MPIDWHTAHLPTHPWLTHQWGAHQLPAHRALQRGSSRPTRRSVNVSIYFHAAGHICLIRIPGQNPNADPGLQWLGATLDRRKCRTSTQPGRTGRLIGPCSSNGAANKTNRFEHPSDFRSLYCASTGHRPTTIRRFHWIAAFNFPMAAGPGRVFGEVLRLAFWSRFSSLAELPRTVVSKPVGFPGRVRESWGSSMAAAEQSLRNLFRFSANVLHSAML